MVSGAGDIKLTKDGHVLLMDMQIQHPTAALIARTATAQDDITGDGTTSNVLFTGELLKQCERYLTEGLHPRVLVEGIELGRERALEFLDSFRYEAKSPSRDQLAQVARTSLRVCAASLAAPGSCSSSSSAWDHRKGRRGVERGREAR